MRYRILGLMLVLVALPFILSDEPRRPPPATPPVAFDIRTPTLPGGRESWLEFARTLLATLIGASVAFAFNRHLQERNQRRTEKAAGNFAMATLGSLYSDYLLLRRMFTEEIERARQLAPHAPTWLPFRPPLHFLRTDYQFDFSSLAFLFEQKEIGVQAAEALRFVEAIHRDLVGHVGKVSEVMRKKGDQLTQAGYRTIDATVTPAKLAEILGAQAVIEMETELETVLEHIRDDEAAYLRASEKLLAALRARFGRDGVIRIEAPKKP